MRGILVALLVSLPVAAAADPSSSLAPIDPGSVPAECAALAQVPPSATIPQPAMEARIAVASCGAQSRFKTVQGGPDAALPALDAASKASFTLLDGVIAANDPVWSSVATKAKANLYLSMVIRARNSIPPITMQTVGQALADHDAAHAALEPKIKSWIDQSH